MRLVLLFLLLISAAPTFAANRHALVIGNDAYLELEPLRKAVNDARAVGDALEKIGFSVLRGENLTQRQMQDSLFELTDRLGKGDTVFFFYAGHGVSIRGGNYLLPIDTPVPKGAQAEGRVRFSGIAEADLIQQVKEAGAQLTIVVLDACRDNPFPKGASRSIGATRGLSRAPDERGVFGLYSAGFGETALDRLSDEDDDPNSVFTRVLAPALTEPGLSLIDLAYLVNEKVEALARAVLHEQSPAYYDQARGKDVYLAGRPPERVTATELAITAPTAAPGAVSLPVLDVCRDAAVHWSEIKVYEDKALYESHLRTFGSCPFAGLAEIALQRLRSVPEKPGITACDNLAAAQLDRDRLEGVAGVDFERIQVDTALLACKAAVRDHPNERRLMFQLGRVYDSAKSYDAAMTWYRKAADAGNAAAMANIGLLYENGEGVARDYAEALIWYRKAAEAGNATAMNNIGLFYHNGRGVARDYAEALIWYRKAAKAGNAMAMNNIGLQYEYGKGVARDHAEAMLWYRKAADAGNAAAVNNIGSLYHNGKGVARDYAEAMLWYREAADAGDSAAMRNIGVLYEYGQGVTRDYAGAMLWYRKAADAGDAVAMNNIGLQYENGRGVTRDYAEAMLWYRKAADAGNAAAMNNIGSLYHNGRGVTRDYAEAMLWYRKAANVGSAVAMRNIGVLYEYGQGVTQNHAEAMLWYRKAAPQPAGQRFTQRLLPDGTEVDAGPGAGNSSASEEGTNIAAASPPSEAGLITPGLIPALEEAETAALPEGTPAPADPASEGRPPPAVPEAGGQVAALPPPAPGVAAAQKAVFYEERSADEPGTQQGGNVVWSVVNVPPAEGQPPEPAIRAVAQVPDEGISLTMTIRRNADQILPASHVIELLFDVPANFGGGQIANVQRLALKPTEDARGEPLIGVAGKISDGFFIIALNNLEQVIESNVDLLSTEQWIDIPLAYATGRRALMSIEKGIPGERAFKEAMDAWAAKT